MKKINCLMILMLFLGVNFVKANKPNVGELGLCDGFSITKGTQSLCPGSISTYEVSHDGHKTINWTVTPNLMEIISISGINIDNYKAAAGIPSNVHVNQIFVSTEFTKVAFDAGFNLNIVKNGDTTNVYVNAGGFVDVTQIPVLRDLLSNIQITGNSIVVRAITAGHGQVVAAATDVTGGAPVIGKAVICYSSISAQRNVVINGAAFPQNFSFNSNFDFNNAPCNQDLNVSIPYIQRVGAFSYRWFGSTGVTIKNASETNATFSFNGKGTYTINFEATDACGTKKVYSKNVKVTYQDIKLLVGGVELLTNKLPLDCNQSKGLDLAVEPWLSNSAIYEWVLPAGWILENRSPYQSNFVNGVPQYTYRGDQSTRYVRIKKSHVNAETGYLTISVSNFCGNDQLTKVIELVAPTNISVQFPAYLVSCENSITLSPTVADAVAPYKLTWSRAGLEGVFSNGTNYISSSVQNTFVAQKFGQGNITVNIEDSRGCTNRATTNVSVFGGNTATDMNISGWLSGHINPSMRADVASNLSKAPDFDRIYFVRNLNGVRQLWFYFFNTSTSKWELKNSNITNLFTGGDNAIHYTKSNGSNDYLFYVNAAGYLEVALIDRTTGVYNGKSYQFIDISPRENNNAQSYTIEDINGSLVRVLWKTKLGDLNIGVILFDSDVVLVVPSSIRTIAQPDFNFNGIVRYDVDKQRNRVFYFRNDGGFYTQHLGNLGVETKINGVLNNDQVWTVSDVVFDNDGNVYFTANGDLFFAEFDLNENYVATYKIETTDGVLTDHLKGDASGYLAINRTTNVLYYAGYNGNIYQAYRDANFAINKQFHIVRATPGSFYDNVSSSMVFNNPHLFYRSKDNQVYNLFYIDIAQVASCKPKWIREGDISETVDARVLENANASTLFGKVYPNPSADKVTVDVWGSKANGKLEVFNLSGEKLLEAAYNFKAQELDVSSLSSGMYIIHVTDGEKSIALKLAKN